MHRISHDHELVCALTSSAHSIGAEDEGGGRIIGGIDFGNDVFPVSADGRISTERAWSGSNKQGDVEWTYFYATITGFFDNPTTVSGTIVERDELNYKGTHYHCSSGEIRWSATRRS